VTGLTGVLDANPIIGLSLGAVFEQLAALYTALYVPPAVVREVIDQGAGLPGAAELQRALGSWVTEVAPDPQRVQQFMGLRSPADREVLAVAQERGVDHIITSDDPLIRHANRYGLVCLPSTLAVVLLKDQGLVSEVRPILDRMRQSGFGIDDPAYESALRAAGE
jgi:predicted nucleic acid-binding protein